MLCPPRQVAVGPDPKLEFPAFSASATLSWAQSSQGPLLSLPSTDPVSLHMSNYRTIAPVVSQGDWEETGDGGDKCRSWGANYSLRAWWLAWASLVSASRSPGYTYGERPGSFLESWLKSYHLLCSACWLKKTHSLTVQIIINHQSFCMLFKILIEYMT